MGAIPYAAVRLALFDGLKWSYRKVRSFVCVHFVHHAINALH